MSYLIEMLLYAAARELVLRAQFHAMTLGYGTQERVDFLRAVRAAEALTGDSAFRVCPRVE
jgi:hypothetical protein